MVEVLEMILLSLLVVGMIVMLLLLKILWKLQVLQDSIQEIKFSSLEGFPMEAPTTRLKAKAVPASLKEVWDRDVKIYQLFHGGRFHSNRECHHIRGRDLSVHLLCKDCVKTHKE